MLSVFTLIVALVLTCVGSVDIRLSDIIGLFSGDISQTKRVILLEIRIPRVIMALLIGMLLASSGVVTQSVFLNPLADPYIIGIASAATFGAVVAYFLKLNEIYYAIFAFIFSAILSFVIFNLYKKAKIYLHF